MLKVKVLESHPKKKLIREGASDKLTSATYTVR